MANMWEKRSLGHDRNDPRQYLSFSDVGNGGVQRLESELSPPPLGPTSKRATG